MVNRGHDVYFISPNCGREGNLQKLVEQDGIKIILTDDNFKKTEFGPGNFEDRPLMHWKNYLKDVFLLNNFDFIIADYFAYPANMLADE